jgi:hypothetical protein
MKNTSGSSRSDSPLDPGTRATGRLAVFIACFSAVLCAGCDLLERSHAAESFDEQNAGQQGREVDGA